MRTILETAEKVLDHDVSVLLLGESGTGKDFLAGAMHACSSRRDEPFVHIECASIPAELFESELFGHERGAFTGANTMKRGLFEIAKGGTLFLDEIGEMDVKLQAKLLRVLQEKAFRRVGGTADMGTDVRVVAATNRDLKERVAAGNFRDDLYHRLSRVVVDVPSLRERNEDVVPMAKQFAERAFTSRGKTFAGFAPEAEQALTGYSWPGNVRELLNVIERVALIWEGNGTLGAKALSLPTGGGTGGITPKLEAVTSPFQPASSAGVESFMDLKKKWSDSFEREYLMSVLNRHGGNVSAAAREAKLDRSNFLRLLRRQQLRATEFRKAA
jgi:transcriptional regulator with GAF, ATPase, and Fis domain